MRRTIKQRLAIASNTSESSRAYLSKVHLVKDNLVRMADTPESSNEGQDSDEEKANLVLSLALGSGSLSASLGKLVKLDIRIERVFFEGLL